MFTIMYKERPFFFPLFVARLNHQRKAIVIHHYKSVHLP